jgi:hypothetical protein
LGDKGCRTGIEFDKLKFLASAEISPSWRSIGSPDDRALGKPSSALSAFAVAGYDLDDVDADDLGVVADDDVAGAGLAVESPRQYATGPDATRYREPNLRISEEELQETPT